MVVCRAWLERAFLLGARHFSTHSYVDVLPKFLLVNPMPVFNAIKLDARIPIPIHPDHGSTRAFGDFHRLFAVRVNVVFYRNHVSSFDTCVFFFQVFLFFLLFLEIVVCVRGDGLDVTRLHGDDLASPCNLHVVPTTIFKEGFYYSFLAIEVITGVKPLELDGRTWGRYAVSPWNQPVVGCVQVMQVCRSMEEHEIVSNK